MARVLNKDDEKAIVCRLVGLRCLRGRSRACAHVFLQRAIAFHEYAAGCDTIKKLADSGDMIASAVVGRA